MRCRASSFKWQYPLLSLRSTSSFLRLLLPHLLATSISPFIFPSITCFRRQFLRKMWPIQLAFLFLISCRIFLCSLTLSNTSSFLTWSVQLIFSILLQHHISKLYRYFWSAARSVQFQHHTKPCSKCSILLVSSSNLSVRWIIGRVYYVKLNVLEGTYLLLWWAGRRWAGAYTVFILKTVVLVQEQREHALQVFLNLFNVWFSFRLVAIFVT